MGSADRMASKGEQGCSYAAMILKDEDMEITEDSMKSLLDAANVEYDSYWPGLFVKALNNQDLDKLICQPSGGGGGGGGGVAVGGGGGGGDGAAAAEKKESSSSEGDAMPAGPGLFDDAGDDY